MSETYYVTTPIYYVNDSPHIGHSYTTIAADVLSRYHRAEGLDVHFLTGTDEHGIKICKAAAERGMEPRELADEVVEHFKQLWVDLNITNDDFIRTTQPRHEGRVQELVRRLVERDEIYLGKYEGWYDEGQEEFVTDLAARDNEYKSVLSGKPLVRYGEDAYFFRLSKWVPKLLAHIEANPDFVAPQARRNEVVSKLNAGVNDLCISRNKSKLPWGVEMPNDPDHVVYVWIDALSNYYTALGLPEIGDEFDGRDEKYWPCTVHLIGKDILWFHAVYWPCMLMALEVPLPKCVFAHGWWTSEGKKMSKSLGNFISRETIAEICQEYSRDVYRYFLLRAVTFGSDGDFSREGLQRTYNNDLANDIGNLLSRTVHMIARYFDGVIPAPESMELSGEDAALLAGPLEHLAADARDIMGRCQFSELLDAVLAVATATNRYIDATEPFKLAKDESQRDRLGTILYTCAEMVRVVLSHLEPFMPEKAAEGLAMLGAGVDDAPLSERAGFGRLTPGAHVHKGEPLFPRKQ